MKEYECKNECVSGKFLISNKFAIEGGKHAHVLGEFSSMENVLIKEGKYGKRVYLSL